MISRQRLWPLDHEAGHTSNVVQWIWASGVWPYNPNTFSHTIRPQFLTLFAHSLIVLQFLSLITHMQFVHHLLSPNTESELPQLHTDETSLCSISLHLTTDSITHTVISSTIRPFTGYVDSYSSLPWVMWEVVTGVEGIPCWELLWHLLANGPWPSTPVKVKGIMLKAAWHWDSDSSVVNDPLGELGHSPLYVGLLSMWGSMDGDRMLSPLSMEGSLNGDSARYKWINNTLALVAEHLSP